MTDIIIQLNDCERLVQTSIDEPIIQTAIQNGLQLTQPCLKGECRSCRAYLISGEVDMKNNFSLFEEEVKRGQILLCQSHPVSTEIIVKLIRVPTVR